MRHLRNALALIFVLCSSCTNSIKPEELYGRWNYVNVDNSNPQDTLPDGELELQSPAIIFNDNNDLIIEWGGKKLSSGKFRMEGQMIRYTEDLAGGRTREFPFLIKTLNETELVFQTMEQNVTTVTARKGR
ncbi:MAG: hypothetical protein WBJ10_08625 [Daejeonella sp.]|uniref:hypothetical protein n=1 Tax=Daejeonella sp. TaxID=2805397 RepID=UPI003C7710A9